MTLGGDQETLRCARRRRYAVHEVERRRSTHVDLVVSAEAPPVLREGLSQAGWLAKPFKQQLCVLIGHITLHTAQSKRQFFDLCVVCTLQKPADCELTQPRMLNCVRYFLVKLVPGCHLSSRVVDDLLRTSLHRQKALQAREISAVVALQTASKEPCDRAPLAGPGGLSQGSIALQLWDSPLCGVVSSIAAADVVE